jgi:hypothetical protein
MTSVSGPAIFNDANGMITDFGLAKIVLGDLAMARLVNRFNPLTDGIVVPYGDLAGMKTATLGIPNWTGTGFGATMAAASSETSDTSLSSFTTGQDTIGVARQELAYGQSFDTLVLGGGRGPLDWPALAESMVDSTIKRFRTLGDTAGATISGSVGSASRDNNYDDVIALSVAFRETSGFSLEFGAPKCVLHSEQMSGINAAIRAEPGLQMPEVHADRFAARDNAGFQGTLCGIDFYQNNSVVDSSSVWQGYAGQTGFLGIAVGNPAALSELPPAGAQHLYDVPALGLSVWIQVSPGTATVKVYAYALLGLALMSSTVRPSFRLIGINN